MESSPDLAKTPLDVEQQPTRALRWNDFGALLGGTFGPAAPVFVALGKEELLVWILALGVVLSAMIAISMNVRESKPDSRRWVFFYHLVATGILLSVISVVDAGIWSQLPGMGSTEDASNGFARLVGVMRYFGILFGIGLFMLMTAPVQESDKKQTK